MGFIIQLVGLFFKLILKIFMFTGAYWIIVPLTANIIYEKVMGSRSPFWLSEGTGYVFLFVLFVMMPLTSIQNIVRLFKKDPTFSIFKAIIGLFSKEKAAVGFVAKLNLDAVKDLSGFVFGRLNGKYVTKKEQTDGHMLIVGGAGSGKTSCIAIPTLMTWQDRVFAIDIKGELYEKTSKRRGTDKIKVFNPTDPTAYGYDPFYMFKHTDDLASEAKSLAMSICPLPADVKDPFWIKGSQNMLTGFMLYFYGLNMSFSETMIQIKSKPVKELIAEIMLSDKATAKMEVSQFSGMDDKTVSGVFAELSNHITLFATNKDLVRALNGEGECITPNDLETGYDIYCCIPEHKIDQWKELFGMMINQFLKSFERRKEGNNKPILFLVDEFPRLGKIETIVNGLATLRSKKIQIALFVQSKSQLNANYGEDLSDVIADNCNYKVVLKAGTPKTQKWCSELVGTYDKMKHSTNKNMDMIGFGKGTGLSESTEDKPIIKPEEFGFMDDAVCIFPTGYYRIEKSSCYDDKNFLIG